MLIDEQDDEFKLWGNYRAVVIDDKDPRDIGRVKVRVLGVYRQDVPDEACPWALPATSLYRSGGENMNPAKGEDMTPDMLRGGFNISGTGGNFTVPAVGNHIFVFFDMGNHMHPIYFAMAPGENDWLVQKQYLKDKVDAKISQIHRLKQRFTPVDGTEGIDGTDWADGAHVNVRQNITSGGQKAPYKLNDSDSTDNTTLGNSEIQGGKYDTRKLNIKNKDKNGVETYNMTNEKRPPNAEDEDIIDRNGKTNVAVKNKEKDREFGTNIGMDVKPLFDNQLKDVTREDVRPDSAKKRLENPHFYDVDDRLDEPSENNRNINRFVTSWTTQGGTTIIVDNRSGQENYYMIHKNYMMNIDQEGSKKEFIGRNADEDNKRRRLVESVIDDDERNVGIPSDVRSNDEQLVDGDKKIHVLGNFNTYTKGNVFMQVDRNMQLDVNDTYGIRVRKGDFDIIIDGQDDDRSRDEESDREPGKTKQYGDVNIDIKNGNLEMHVKENVNLHVEGACNLKVDGDMRTHVEQSYHLHVEGDYNEFIEGNRYSTVEQNVECRWNEKSKGHTKYIIYGDRLTDIEKKEHLKVKLGRFTEIDTGDDSLKVNSKIKMKASSSIDLDTPSNLNVTASKNSFSGPGHFNGNVFSNQTNLNTYTQHTHKYHPGPGGPTDTYPWGQGGGSPTAPAQPVAPSSGFNRGGGVIPDATDINLINGAESNPVYTNRTIKARRKHNHADQEVQKENDRRPKDRPTTESFDEKPSGLQVNKPTGQN